MRFTLRVVAAFALVLASACGKEDQTEGSGHHRGGTSGAGMSGEGGVPDTGGSGGNAGATGGDAGEPGGTATGGATTGGTSGSSGEAGEGGQGGAAGEGGDGGEAGEGGAGAPGGAAGSGGGGIAGAAGSGGGGTMGGTAGIGMMGGGMANGGMAGQAGNAGASGQAGTGGAGAGGGGGGGRGGASGGGAGGAGRGGGGLGGAGMAGAGGMAGMGGWTSVPVTGDPLLPRRGHTATLDQARSLVYVFGGQGYHDLYADLMSFDWRTGVVTRLPTQGSAPSARRNHVAVLDSVRRRLLVFGGRGYYDLFDDVYAADVDSAPLTWTRLAPTGAAPSRREGHVAVFDAARNRMIVFGGESYYDLVDDTWELAFSASANGTWRELAPAGTPPAPRTEASVAFDASTSRVFVGGGAGFHDVELDLAVLDLTTGDGTWSSQSPAPVTGVSGAWVWDELANRLFQQSGQAYYGLLGSPGGPELLDAALVYVESEPAAFLFLGQGYHQLSGRIWRLDL